MRWAGQAIDLSLHLFDAGRQLITIEKVPHPLAT